MAEKRGSRRAQDRRQKKKERNIAQQTEQLGAKERGVMVGITANRLLGHMAKGKQDNLRWGTRLGNGYPNAFGAFFFFVSLGRRGKGRHGRFSCCAFETITTIFIFRVIRTTRPWGSIGDGLLQGIPAGKLAKRGRARAQISGSEDTVQHQHGHLW